MRQRKYLLRWRFDYHDNRPSRAGMWSREATNITEMAAFQNKSGLSLALVEVKSIDTQETRIIAECPGQDFRNFEWQAETWFGCGRQACVIIGLTIVTRDHLVECYHDGEVAIKPLTEAHRVINFASYGR